MSLAAAVSESFGFFSKMAAASACHLAACLRAASACATLYVLDHTPLLSSFSPISAMTSIGTRTLRAPKYSSGHVAVDLVIGFDGGEIPGKSSLRPLSRQQLGQRGTQSYFLAGIRAAIKRRARAH